MWWKIIKSSKVTHVQFISRPNSYEFLIWILNVVAMATTSNSPFGSQLPTLLGDVINVSYIYLALGLRLITNDGGLICWAKFTTICCHGNKFCISTQSLVILCCMW